MRKKFSYSTWLVEAMGLTVMAWFACTSCCFCVLGYVLEGVVCVGVALVMANVHVLVCEYAKFVELLFESGL